MAKKKPEWLGPVKATYHAYRAYDSLQSLKRQDPSAFSETLVHLGIVVVAIIIALI